jgi:hypothetical protein
VSSCKADDEIPAVARESANQFAMQFVQDALGPNLQNAYASFSADAKTNISYENFVSIFEQAVQPMAPFTDLHVTHTYFPKVTGGDQPRQVVCGNLSSTNSWVAVTAKPGPSQAHIVMEAQTRNNTWAFISWLVSENGSWKVEYIQSAAIAMVGKTAKDLRAEAAREEKKNHNFNAFVLYVTALQFSYRGPHLQLGTQQDIQKEIEQVRAQVPHEFQGRPPFHWQFGPSSFTILKFGPIGVSGKIYLQIDHQMEPWTDDKQADQRNHELISAFANAHPEYKDVFAGMVVRAHEQNGNRGFGTVAENEPTSNK